MRYIPFTGFQIIDSGTAILVNGIQVVVFGEPQLATDYKVILTKNVNENVWDINKTLNGFTINSSNKHSTASVDWAIIE